MCGIKFDLLKPGTV